MATTPQTRLPIPDCWHDTWQKFAEAQGLSEFPTRQFLQNHPQHSGPFCRWLWRELATRRGAMCREPVARACETCQREGVSAVISVRILALVVRDAEPTLHAALESMFERMTSPYPKVRRGRSPYRPPSPRTTPDPNGPDRLPPLAVNMPVPQPIHFANLVARELKHRPWLDDWLDMKHPEDKQPRPA